MSRAHSETYLATLEMLEDGQSARFGGLSPSAYARRLISGGYPVLFDVGHLAHVTGLSRQVVALMGGRTSEFYSSFVIAKKNRGSREIDAPHFELKRVQIWCNRNIASRIRVEDCVHGFVPGRSIVTHAKSHVAAELIVRIDIQDFFPSVRLPRVRRTFSRLGYTPEVSELLARLCTHRGRLPQGAPTSPALANDAFRECDQRIAAFARRRGIKYTRYADDLTFSGRDRYLRSPRFVRTVESIVRDSGFRVNPNKTLYLRPYDSQRVTGLTVNAAVNAPRERRRWLRQELYFLERYGVDDHLSRRGVERSRYKEFVYGHVYSLLMTNREEAREYLERLDRLAWPY